MLTLERRRRLQLEELTVLDEIKQICDRHGIRYYLTAGTLLGAVRHGGFIPWDDDADIAMPRRDFDRFAKICRTELSEGFFYQSEKTEKHYPFYFAKVRKDGTSVSERVLEGVDIHKGCYVDIFPLDKCPRSPRLGRLMFKLVEVCSCAIIAKESGDFVCQYEKRSARTLFALIKKLPRPIQRSLRNGIRKFFGLFTSGRRLATISGTHGHPRETYEREWFEKTVLLPFEGREYPAPHAYRELLTNMYGDYMTPPDESERVGHFEDSEN